MSRHLPEVGRGADGSRRGSTGTKDPSGMTVWVCSDKTKEARMAGVLGARGGDETAEVTPRWTRLTDYVEGWDFLNFILTLGVELN